MRTIIFFSPLIQSSQASTRWAVYISLVAAFATYAHFCYDVITTITTERESKAICLTTDRI